METIRIIVKSIVVIIIFAAFLEIILPRSDMKRYVNLIIGLFVIIAVLNPFLSALNRGISFDVLSDVGQSGAADTQTLIQNGKDLANAQRTGAVREYKDKLARQIAAMAGLCQKDRISGVDIDMVDDTGSPDFGTVKKVTLHLNKAKDAAMLKSQDEPVGDVKVDEIRIGAPDPLAEANQSPSQSDVPALREMIANFYGLSPDQIVIEN